MPRESAETIAIATGVDVALSRVRRADGSDIVVYALEDPDRRGVRPSIVLLHGSGADSVFPQSERGMSTSLLFGALCEIRDRWNVYLVEKRGIRFGQCAPPEGAENADREYLEGASYEGRVADVCAVLDELATERTGENRPLVVIGSSEGSDVAAGVAARHGAPTHVALLPFSAGHGLADSLTGLRGELDRGEITAEEFQEQYDWLVETFRGVFGESGDRLDRFLWGHSYRRWRSHCSGQVMVDLLGVEIPVFLGIPSLDRCEGVDLAVAEFVKRGKGNLTYRNYINYDHGFFEHVGERVECRHAEVLADILEWVRESG